jgi:hypothetical protein
VLAAIVERFFGQLKHFLSLGQTRLKFSRPSAVAAAMILLD